MIQIYPNPYENNPTWFFGIPIRNSPLSTYSYLSSIDYEVGVYDHSTKWGSSHVSYNTYLSATQGYRYSHILFYGGGRLWPSGFDPNVTGVVDTYGEYDNSATLKHAIQQAVDQGQPIYLNLNCLVPTFYRAPGVTAGWTGFEQASPDPVNHDKIASVYSSVVSYFLPSGIVGVTVGSELKGMYSTQPCATVGIPQGWDIPRYWDLYEKIYDKVKAVDSEIKVYGPYLQFYDNLPNDPSKRINISGVYVRDECVSALNEFIASASVNDKYDGVGFDAVMPVSAWPTLIRYVREKMAPGKHVIVTECYKDPLDGGDTSDDITTALLQTIEDNLQPNDRAFVWGDPQFFSSAPLILPSITTPSSAFVYRCGDPSAWAPFDNAFSVYGTGVTGVPANTYSLWGYKKEARFNYLNYGTDSTSRIRVRSKKGSINQVDIGPYKKNFNSKWSQISSDTIEISGIEAYDKLIVVTNNDLSSPLYVFANPIEVIPTPRSFNDLSSFFYVSAGIWEISALLTNAGLTGTYTDGPEYVSRLNVPSSNYTVYLAPGAYVDGSFSVRLKNNVTFSGPGIIDPGRRFIGNWWSSIGFEATGVNDSDKLRYASIYGFSSFTESYNITQQTSSVKILGPTIVNSVIYGTSIIPIQVDNVKLISLWPNCDGFHVDDPHTTPDEDRYSSITRCFIQTGDDTVYVGGNQGQGNHLVSGCYLINLAGCLFRSYFGQYAGANDYRAQKNHWFSAIDLDCRAYSVPSYNGLDKPLYETYFNAIFGINQTERKRQWKSYYSDYSSVYITNHLFSGIRVENLIDVPVFDIGIRPYPETPGFDSDTYDYTPGYGNISSIIFKDITVSSHPNSRYKWIKENKLFANERQYRPHDVSFINVNIDGNVLTDTNKDQYFVWNTKPVPRDKDIGMTNASYAGSAIVDMYVIIGDSIAAGADSKYSDRTGTNYAGLPSQVTGCYIWVPSSTSFEVMKPGNNIPVNSYYGGTVTGVAGLESTLAWKARQFTGDRDVYVVKYAQGGALFVSATSATWASTQASPASNYTDWSISSTGEMVSGLSATINSAILSLSSQYKHVNLKAVIIAAGTNAPIQTAEFLYDSTYTVTSVNPYKNTSLVSSLINTEVSSFLISGLGQIFGTPRTETDLNYTKYIWILPAGEGEWYDVNGLNNYYKNLNNKIRSFSSPEYWESSLSSVLVPTRIIPYLPPSESFYRPPGDGVHFNFSGVARITDDIYQILQRESRSVTDPRLNPEINYQFYPKPAVEIYDNPFDVEKTFTLYTNNDYARNVSSAYYNVSIYDANLGTYVSSFVYRCGHDRFYAPWSENVWSVHGSGNPVDDGYKVGLAPWGPSAAGSFNYTNFGISGPVNVKIDYKRSPRNGALQTSDISIGPFSKNKQFTIQNTSSIIIQNVYPYDKLAVEINYDTSNPLFIFANPYRDTRPTIYLTPTTLSANAGSPGDTIYFGPGFYEFSSFAARNYALPIDDNKVSSLPEWSFSAQDNQTIYIDAGAYIRGNIDTRYASAVNILGYGVIESYWLQDFYERMIPVHEEKLRVTAFRGYSNFADGSEAISRGRHSNVKGVTVVNNVAYFNTSFFRNVDNIKYIGPYFNADGPRFGDYPAFTPNSSPDASTIKINASASYTRSFQMAGDDGFTNPTEAASVSLLASSIYAWSLAATIFRTYDAPYSFKEANPDKNIIGNGFSAFDIDVRNYAAYAYNLPKSAPINNKSKISIVGIWYSPQSNNDYNFNGINDILISGLRVENPTDIPLFDIGFRYYPFINSSPELGSEFSDWKAFPLRKGRISNITLADISISSHPSSIGRYVYSNAIMGAPNDMWPDGSPAISGITLRNVRIDGIPITNTNYRNYITFENKDLLVPSSITNRASWMPANYGSSIVDFYIVIGGGIVDGTSGVASELLTYSDYSSIANGVSGCYIFRGVKANATTGEFGSFTSPRFEPFRPGKNTIPESETITDLNNSMGPEISLFNRLRQNTNRDIYVVKLTRPGTIAFSGVSASWGTAAGNWSVSSPAGGTKMYDKLKSWCGSAINILYNEGKIIDFKGAVIMVGDDVPSYITDETFTRNMIETEISSLYYGIRDSISSSSLDVNNLNVIWSIPNPINLEVTGYPNYYSSIRTHTSSLANKDYRFNYFELSSIPSAQRPGGFFYNTSGHLLIGENIAGMFISQTSSTTDLALNSDLNFSFGLSNGMKNWVKVNGVWKEADTWVKQDGVWKFVTPSVKVSNNWK